eukprot:3354820-Amphidinium_carterae.1
MREVWPITETSWKSSHTVGRNANGHFTLLILDPWKVTVKCAAIGTWAERQQAMGKKAGTLRHMHLRNSHLGSVLLLYTATNPLLCNHFAKQLPKL